MRNTILSLALLASCSATVAPPPANIPVMLIDAEKPNSDRIPIGAHAALLVEPGRAYICQGSACYMFADWSKPAPTPEAKKPEEPKPEEEPPAKPDAPKSDATKSDPAAAKSKTVEKPPQKK